ncbi:2-dehydropantoate 2-reductase [Clostridium aceticum]|uniref:2-dehydropantoate 2-reductase n=1 Tax=Clostridium aceticum TaxID=84022 RepID=A0A0D8I9I9_9CLOT|nr:2-dehydropantoate 2-reductase [Clostridium aceticum]AKL95717.1 2-dehydropantoate 2-reductase [Clostridium aceticum]KJF26729.1 oxidoreductase [Clostridium aceticum]
MKYLIVGAGGTGGCIGAYMSAAGKDVTLIARGDHLLEMQKHGLKMETIHKGNYIVHPIKAFDMDHYDGSPDVIFVCVKGYSIDDTILFIKKVANKNTVVIPILNIYGTGNKIQKQLPELTVTDGCIYVSANIKEPGVIKMHGDIFKIVYGVRNPSEYPSVLEEIANDLKESGITGIISDNIERDCLQKFSYVSPMAACGLYYGCTAEAMQKQGEIRDCFVSLIREIELLANAMGIFFTVDIIPTNLDILDALSPTASTSMQRDLSIGKQSEIDGLIFEVVRIGKKVGVPLLNYEKIARKFGFN